MEEQYSHFWPAQCSCQGVWSADCPAPPACLLGRWTHCSPLPSCPCPCPDPHAPSCQDPPGPRPPGRRDPPGRWPLDPPPPARHPCPGRGRRPHPAPRQDPLNPGLPQGLPHPVLRPLLEQRKGNSHLGISLVWLLEAQRHGQKDRQICTKLLFVLHVVSNKIAMCTSGMGPLRQWYILPHWDKSCRSHLQSHPVPVYWHHANQSLNWPFKARGLTE